MKMIYYIAYGSNLNLKHFLKICPSAKLISTSLLPNMTLVFKGEEDSLSYLTLEEEIGSTTPVGIFEISYFDSFRLDRYEGYPLLYFKKWITLEVCDRAINAMTYIMNYSFDYHMPSSAYFKTCLKGYDNFKFDKKYLINALKTTNSRLKKEPKR